MPDTDKLRKLVDHFAFSSKPSNGSSSAPCTVGDINRVIENVSKVLYAFIEELEESE